MAYCFVGGLAPALAQDAPAPVMVDISDLPSLHRLKQKPNWSEEDTHTAVSMIRKYLKDHQQEFPVDCRFELTPSIISQYEQLEERSTVENRLRRMNIPLVMFTQDGVWKDYPAPKTEFHPLKPDAPEWKKFLREELPRIDAFLREAYQVPYPHGPMVFKSLRLKGYADVCPDIQRYLTHYYKAFPSGVECGAEFDNAARDYDVIKESRTDSFHIEAYKSPYPYANSYSYRVLRILDCTFPEKKQAPETAIEDDKPNLNTDPNHAEMGKVRHGRYNEKKEHRVALRKERRKEAEDIRADKARTRQERIETQKTEKEMQELKDKLTPKWLPQDNQNETVTASNEAGQQLVKAFQELHKHPLDISQQLSSDEKKLAALLDQVTTEEKKFQDSVNAKYGVKDEVLSVQLDPREPFTIAEIPLDTPLTTADLVKMIRYFITVDNKWLYGCRGYSLVQIDESNAQYPKRSLIRCLVPHIIVKTKLSTPDYRYVRIPYPAISSGLKQLNNQCGVIKGTKAVKRFGFKNFTLFRFKGKTTKVDESYFALKNKAFPVELQVGGGIRGRILDKITKLPIAGAHARILSVFGPQNANTTADGQYLFPTVPHRGLKMEVYGSHRKYQDGSGPITELKVAEIADQPDFYLDPKRVTVRGKIKETFKPKYGSGLKGIRVEFVGFEKEFFADTNENGEYEIKNVPSSLVKMTSHDYTRGHNDGNRTVDLDPDHDNNNVDLVMEPRLTILSGKVKIPKGRGVKGLTIFIEGYPEYTTVTKDDGSYEFKDIPINLTKITVLPDKENIYGGNSADLTQLTPYERNVKDIIVPYNRSDISGRVVDIIEREGIAGASVWVEGGKERYHATTDANGYYEIIEVPDTARVLKVETAGNKYIDRPRNIDPLPEPGKDVPHQDFNLVPREYTKNRIVFILTWNEKQWDLDSQLFFPNDMHLYYKTLSDSSLSTTGGATLDKDDTGNSGRETTIIELTDGNTKLPGTYPFLVYQYVDNGIRFADSNALVEVYRDGEFIKEIKPGPGTGRLWYVADVTAKDVHEVNQFPIDLQSEIAKINDSIVKKEDAAKDLKTAIEVDTKSIADQIAGQKADNDTVKKLQDELTALTNPPPPAPPAKTDSLPPAQKQPAVPNASAKARQKELKTQIKTLKDKIAKQEVAIKKAQDELKKKIDNSSKAEAEAKKYREDSMNKIKELEKNMALTLKNYR